MTLEDALKEWEETGKHGTREERIARGKKWLPYYALLAERQKGVPYTLPETPNEFVSELFRREVVKPGDTLLDIGAGLGSYALEFSRLGCRVTAMDSSRECLGVMEQRAKQNGLTIETIQSTWEEWQPKQKYDITFSSMCPAICNMEELERMEAVTQKTCVLITVTRGSYDKHRKAMMAALQIQPQGGMTTEALHYMSALYLSGRQFHMTSRTTASAHKVSAAAIMEQYPIYFRIFGISQADSIAFLEKYLAENTKDGFLEDESRMNLAMLDWNV